MTERQGNVWPGLEGRVGVCQANNSFSGEDVSCARCGGREEAFASQELFRIVEGRAGLEEDGGT